MSKTSPKKRSMRFAAMLALTLGSGGCANTDGPVFGDWQGRQPTGAGIYPSFVTLVLHGNPGDTQGIYDIQAVVMQPTYDNTGSRQLTWGDRWTLTSTPAADQPPLLVLHNLPNSQISRYVLMGNGVLLPATEKGLPDTSPGSLRYGLTPVPKSNWGYGRL